jgi:filamentous hemagglutinin family protein
MPTLLSSLIIQIVAALLLGLPYIPIAGQVHAASSITQTTGPGAIGTIVTPNGNVYGITEGTPVVNNLFHSFAQFSVDAGDIAQFQTTTLLPNTAIHNILGRVTGQNPSSIFGTIDSASYYPGANLFLMNPNGIVFGPSAELNVGGSVAFTTADYIRLAEATGSNAGIFHAETTSTSLLTNASVAAFGFLGSNPAAIAVQGSTLSVKPGQSISLVGGNHGFTSTPSTGSTASVPNGVTVMNGAHLLAPGGQVNIASVASRGEVLAGTLEYAPNVKVESFGALGTIEVSQKSSIDVSGNGGGTVLIRGGQFMLDNSRISASITGPGPVTNGVESIGDGINIVVSQDAMIQNLSLIETNVTGNATPGVTYSGVHVKADHIEIVGVPDLEKLLFTGIQSGVLPGSTGGNSGNITLEANTILMKDLVLLDASVGKIEGEKNGLLGGTGNAGNISATANQDLKADLTLITANSSGGSTGNAGNIALTSTQGSISLATLSRVSSQSSFGGNTGNITLSALHGDILLAGENTAINTQTFHGGALGSIQIAANNLRLTGGASISGDNFNSIITPGNISLNLSGSLNLADGSFIQTVARVRTPAAALNITAHDITVTGESRLSTESKSSGTGGPLNIFTNNLTLMSGGQIKSGSTLGKDPDTGAPVIPIGPGGTITIQGRIGPADSILIDGQQNGNPSGIITNTEGTGVGGATNLSARSLTIQNGGTISAETSGTAPSAVGGSITVETIDHVTMTSGASITASSTDPGKANAGDISIDAGQKFDMRDSSVTAKAKLASGGNIDIQATDRIRIVNSEISSSVQGSASTAGGNITIDPNVVVLQNSEVTARAVQGAGGNITIFTPLFLADSSSLVSASSQFGLNGTVTIQSPTSNLSESLGPLPSNPSQAHSLLTQRCAALVNNGQTSSFVVAGREQLPADPGGWLSSPLAFAALGESLDAGHAVTAAPAVMAMATDDTGTVSLRRLTPAGFLMANFAESEATGCRS